MKHTTALMALVGLLSWAGQAQALYKCSAPDGKTSFQDAPCPADARNLVIRVSPSPSANPPPTDPTDWKRINSDIDARLAIQQAIAQGRPVRGMTRAQLDAAMGSPSQVNTGDYPGGFTEQLVYERRDRRVYVYTENGLVSAVQEQQRGSVAPETSGPCPSAHTIRNEEVSASSMSIGDAERAERQRRVSKMKECGR